MSAAGIALVLTEALLLASEGRHCFPCLATKRPASPHGFKDATDNPKELQALWLKYPGELIGVSTGSISGIDVLDLDVKHPEAKAWWQDNRHQFPRTRVHRTRSGGLHLYFKHHDGVRCTTSKIALGVDTRGAGGYVIWWPATGLPILLDAPVALWPEWFLSELRPKPRPSTPVARVPSHHFIAKLVHLVAAASEGERNSLTYWAASRLEAMNHGRSGAVIL